MTGWVSFMVISQLLQRVGVGRFATMVGKLLVGWIVVSSAALFIGIGAETVTVVAGKSPVAIPSIVAAGIAFLGAVQWFRRDGQQNDRFFNEYAGGGLFSRYSLKSVAGLSVIAVGFTISPPFIVLGSLSAVWYLWKHDWPGRPHGIVALGVVLGVAALSATGSVDGVWTSTIAIATAALVSTYYSPGETGWSRGQPTWIWSFDWTQRMWLPTEPHPDYDGNAINNMYPDEASEPADSDTGSAPDPSPQRGEQAGASTSDGASSGGGPQHGHTPNTPTGGNATRSQPSTERESERTRGQPGTQDETSTMEAAEFNWEEPPDVHIEAIGGYDHVKDQLRNEVILPVRDDNPGFDRYGIEPSRGLLFHGPPGTGKTLFARALANELNRPFVELSQADLTSEYINEGAQLVERVFEEAQALGGVVFIDEADQLLSKRSGRNQHNEDQKVMNTFLPALSRDDQEFIVILTTNRRDLIDDAVLRPGRIDREIELALPDEQARAQILKTKLAEIPHGLSMVDVEEIAAQTAGWSGAELDSLLTNARRAAAIQNAPQLNRSHVDLGSVDR